ncbi:MAG: hypothetical protein LBQ02_02880 [Candidatus Nomurabacteria bacterium]|jgi:hypothetical protein|nr:hypothetical protein [Candidatus Nomurabacteria bacterium]
MEHNSYTRNPDSMTDEERQAFIEQYGNPEQLRVAMIDQSHDARESARDFADYRLNKELGDAKGVRGFLKKIWKGNYAKEYYRSKYAREALEDIKHQQNIYAKQGEEGEASRARLATIQRFQSEYEEMIHEGENKEELGQDAPAVVAIKEAIKTYAETDNVETAKANLEEAKKRILKDYYAMDIDEITSNETGQSWRERRERSKAHGEAGDMVMVDNLTAIAEQARLAVDHGFAIENVMNGMKVINGESRSGVRSEAKLSKVDKVIEKLQEKSRGLVNPTTIALGASAVACALKFAERGVIGKAASVIVPGVSAALFAGLNEKVKLKEERAQHMREMAQGKKMSETDKARAELDATIYDMRGAGEMTAELNDTLAFLNGLSRETAPTAEQQSQIEAARQALSAIDARIRLSDRKGIDLVAYSDVMNVEAERFALDKTRAETRKALMDLRRGLNPDEYNNRGGDEAFRQALASDALRVEATIEQEEITTKDQAYKKLRNRRVAKAAAVGGLTGLMIGTGMQEAMAFANNNVVGGIEHLFNPNATGTRGTMLFSVLNNEGEGGVALLGATRTLETSDTLNDTQHGGNGTVRLSSESNLVQDQDGTYSILDSRQGGQTRVAGLTIDQQTGQFTEESLDRLRELNYAVDVSSENVLIDTSTTETITQPMSEWLENNQNSTEVSRTIWFGNDTSGVYEGSELAFHYNGVDDNGLLSFDYNLDAPAPHQAGEVLNLHELSDAGRLFVSITPDGSHQSQAIVAELIDGKLHIDPNSAFGQAFDLSQTTGPTSGRSFQEMFKGAYIEVFTPREEVTKTVIDGVTQLTTADGGPVNIAVLATQTGQNAMDAITSTVTTTQPVPTEIFHTNILAPDLIEPIPTYVTETEMPPIIPIVPRRSLQAAERSPAPPPIDIDYGYYYNGGESTPDVISPRYQNEAGTWVEADGSPVERNVQRERQNIGAYIERQRQRDPAHIARVEAVANKLPPIGNEVRVAVNVPAYMEEKNIYHFLEEYMKQKDPQGNRLNPQTFEINVMVNRREGTPPDNTVGEIERFIRDYNTNNAGSPANINYYDIELDESHANVGYARKLITDATLMRNLQRANQTSPLYIESEDADITHIDTHTISNLIEALDKNPHLDMVRGMDDRDPEILKQNDYLFLRRRATDFAQKLMAGRRMLRNLNNPNWNSQWNRVYMNGWNSGYSAESYALAGGYNSVRSGEDMQLGEKVTKMRGGDGAPRGENLEVIGWVKTRSSSLPRRELMGVIEGKQTYSGFGDEELEKRIRSMTITEMLDDIQDLSRIDNNNQDKFTGFLKGMATHIKNDLAMHSAKEVEKSVKRMLWGLGFKSADYSISMTDKNGQPLTSDVYNPDQTDIHLNINTLDNLKAALNRYRAENRDTWFLKRY